MDNITDEYNYALDRGLTIKDTAKILGYSRDTIMRMLKAGELHAYGKGRKTRIYEYSIHEYRHRTDFCNRTVDTADKNITKVSQRHRAAMERIHRLLE
jgi:excisionase family DNA binding protein